MNKILRLLVPVLLGAGPVLGGGSVSFDDQFLPLLQQNKPLAAALLKTFDFRDSVYAQSDFGDHTQFGGEKLGPYTVLAKPKGSASEWVFEITVQTTWTVYDRNGQVIALKDENGKMTGIFEPNAVRLEETFDRLTIKPWVPPSP